MDTIISALNAGASVFIAAIAFCSLKTWQCQDKAKNKAELLNAVLDAFHTYAMNLTRSSEALRFIRKSMNGKWKKTGRDPIFEIAYIQRNGMPDRKNLEKALLDSQLPENRLRDLILIVT
ncbi:hypothetical protein HEQ72_11200 [Haematospirillum sp. 15-248]|uniref:hypothetical protein n=1 Tax=Haematospirillum sp. 15-248 TaxID=2723107 RepID=UPI00143C25A8|nr:hypothetical protein [Haematospirillum sp. 15-248]NKD88858.1 hypothetical protein [Haematospirillum sp. 15-248]